MDACRNNAAGWKQRRHSPHTASTSPTCLLLLLSQERFAALRLEGGGLLLSRLHAAKPIGIRKARSVRVCGEGGKLGGGAGWGSAAATTVSPGKSGGPRLPGYVA